MEFSQTSEWTSFDGGCEVQVRPETFRIFPKGRDGKTRPVTIRRVWVDVRRETLTGDYSGMTFKYYSHQKNLFWGDSRKKGSCSKAHVRDELARMIFKGDKSCAAEFIAHAESRI
jgi:hypothetical protein